MNFKDKLKAITQKNSSLLCVGLDSQWEKLPKHLAGKQNAIFEFNKAIIDATADLVCAYKLNTAFYEAQGIEGIQQLKLSVDYLKEKYPDIPIIIDAKRGDIESTNEGYVRFVFDFLGADAVTIHPYLGKEAVKPFLDKGDKGIFILCKTSNPGAGEFQDLTLDSGNQQIKLYQYVAEKVTKEWNYNGNCGLVVGATYPTELDIVRRIAGDMLILIPGIGTQGGDLEKTVQAGKDQKGNVIINSSRAIIFAGSGEDFAQKAREEAIKLRNLINSFR